MKKAVIILSVFSFITISCGQSSRKATKDNAGVLTNTETKDAFQSSIIQFVPESYSVLDTTSDDLNLDQYMDMIVVLKKNGEDTTSNVIDHPEKRPLLILSGQSDNTYTLARRNDNVVYCVDCGGMMGDPFTGIVLST